MREFGLELPDNVGVRVHDSTADIRYIELLLPPKAPRLGAKVISLSS
jgi:nitrile hydratase